MARTHRAKEPPPRRPARWGLALVLLLAAGCTARPEVRVGAAMSLYDVLPGILSEAEDAVEVTFAGSSTLVRQVAAGAPIDVLVTADRDSLRPVADRFEVLCVAATNRLVRIEPQDGGTAGPLALAAPHVPAGRYARRVLPAAALGEVVTFDHVRGVLAAVARGDASAGVVYATDADIAKGVDIAYVFPKDTHDPIVYPLLLLRGEHDAAAARALFEAFLTPDAARAFRRRGFRVVAEATER